MHRTSQLSGPSGKASRAILLIATAGALCLPAPVLAAPKESGKTVVKTQDDLPRFSYPISGNAVDLVTADDATFAAFAAKVRTDIDATLARYEIEDHETLRQLLGVRLNLQILSGTEDRAALETIAQIRALEDKPDARLTSGQQMEALLNARIATGQTSGPALVADFARRFATSLNVLPWTVVGTRIREAKHNFQVYNKGILIGLIKQQIEPGVTNAHELSGISPWELVRRRVQLKIVLPILDPTVEALTRFVSANTVEKPDIWADREVTLTAADKLTPVNVAIWDSGTDLALFPRQTYTDPHPKPPAGAHGLSYDLRSYPVPGNIQPLNEEQGRHYAGALDDVKGNSDLELSIDSPEAAAVMRKAAALSAEAFPKYSEEQAFFGNYVHGTAVASLASHGNPAARLSVAGFTDEWRNVPPPPTDADVKRLATSYQAEVDWFRAHGVRVVNMSWGVGPQGYETTLEANGVGEDPEERKQMARHFFAIDRDGLVGALKSAPDVLFICGAGNANSDSGFNEVVPSSLDLPNLLTVGAVDQAGDEASFTSYGDRVRVDANGYRVETQVPGGRVLRLSGTSFASPNTTNLAAKLIALDPKLTPPEVIRLIIDGATPSADGRRHNINPKRSVELLRNRAQTRQ